MGFFKQAVQDVQTPNQGKYKGLPPLPPPNLRGTHELTNAMVAGSWLPLAARLKEESHPVSRMEYLTIVLDDHGAVEGAVEEWVKGDCSEHALQAQALISVNAGFAERGDGPAEGVDPQAWENLRASCSRAEDSLTRAAKLNPNDPNSYVLQLKVAVGLQYSLPHFRKNFLKAVALCPDHQMAHSRMLSALTQKWFGSHDEMFAFARWAVSRAPRTSTPLVFARGLSRAGNSWSTRCC